MLKIKNSNYEPETFSGFYSSILDRPWVQVLLVILSAYGVQTCS